MLVNIRKLRVARNITQQELAKAASCSQQTLSKIENGHSIPSVDLVCRIADFFDTSVDFLLGRTTNPRSIKGGYPDGLSSQEVMLMETIRGLDEQEREFLDKAVWGISSRKTNK